MHDPIKNTHDTDDDAAAGRPFAPSHTFRSGDVTMKQFFLGLVVFVVCSVSAPIVEGHTVFQLTDSDGDVQSDFFIGGVGQSVDVNIWLRQEGDTVLTDEGLSSAGIQMSYDTLGAAAVSDEQDIASNPLFNDPNALLKTFGTGYCTVDMATANFDTVFPELATPDRVWLGTFTFTGLRAGNMPITASDIAGQDDTLTGLGTLLDAQIGSAAATIHTVPEPGSAVILAGLALILVARFRRP
jgi:hypothetical protein